MLRNKELRRHIAKEYRYAVTKMQEAKDPARKLFYFSALFGELQRLLNFEWDRDLVLIYTVTQHCYTQINAISQNPVAGMSLPIAWTGIYEKLTQVASDLANYFEKMEKEDNRELYQLLVRLSEIAYAVSGNGSYLHEKGAFKI